MDEQMCTVDDITGGEPCRRLARWRWDLPDRDPVFLCNHHAEPFEEVWRAPGRSSPHM